MNFLDARSDFASDRRRPRDPARSDWAIRRERTAVYVTSGVAGFLPHVAPKTFNGILTAGYWISAGRYAVELCCGIASAARTDTISVAGLRLVSSVPDSRYIGLRCAIRPSQMMLHEHSWNSRVHISDLWNGSGHCFFRVCGVRAKSPTAVLEEDPAWQPGQLQDRRTRDIAWRRWAAATFWCLAGS